MKPLEVSPIFNQQFYSDLDLDMMSALRLSRKACPGGAVLSILAKALELMAQGPFSIFNLFLLDRATVHFS